MDGQKTADSGQQTADSASREGNGQEAMGIGALHSAPATQHSALLTVEPLEPKPGYKTSEFWLVALSTLLAALISTGAIVEASNVGKIVGAVVMTLNILGYTVSRGMVKAATVKAALAGMMLITIGTSSIGCQLIQPSYVAADRATYDAIASDHRKYINTDDTLSDEERARANRTLDSWDFRIRMAEKAGASR